ncbi:phosphotransferase enzyme family protein [Sporosarcina sp. ACRSL]|uniref:phosphotransferase enzyme family protein n=1 Tax=Sporosarcina sp. ACRSL TaxID=2918215 RepID=UPI001EF3FEA3|nr:phosphotransferase [Sporosarcina sp. ACRSL]
MACFEDVMGNEEMTFIKGQFIVEKLAALLESEVIDIVPASDGYHNQVFSITCKDDKIVARLSPCIRRTREEIEEELDWISVLNKAGLRVAKPIQIPGHEQIIEFEALDSDYWLVLFEHTEGRPVDLTDPNEWNQDFFHEWGRQIGVMHTVQMSHVNRKAFWDSGWKGNVSDAEWLKDRRESLLDDMLSWGREQLTFGLVHNDLHQGNFHVNENGMIFFDFDDCTFHFFAQDLAVSIYHALWTGTSFNPEQVNFPVEFLTAFLEGYRTSRPLTFEMYDQLLVCLQMREIYLYSLFVSKWNTAEMLEWQAKKLEQLKGNIQGCIVPYIDELEKVKHLFEV